MSPAIKCICDGLDELSDKKRYGYGHHRGVGLPIRIDSYVFMTEEALLDTELQSILLDRQPTSVSMDLRGCPILAWINLDSQHAVRIVVLCEGKMEITRLFHDTEATISGVFDWPEAKREIRRCMNWLAESPTL